jgi:hypothetical protein
MPKSEDLSSVFKLQSFSPSPSKTSQHRDRPSLQILKKQTSLSLALMSTTAKRVEKIRQIVRLKQIGGFRIGPIGSEQQQLIRHAPPTRSRSRALHHQRFHTSNPRPRAAGQTSPTMAPRRPPPPSLKSN